MIALLVEGLFHWGFSTRVITESAGAQYYLFPPPSTLIGALTYGISILKDLPECELIQGKKGSNRTISGAMRLQNIVKWATFALSDELSIGGHATAVGYADFMRSFRLIYQRGVRHTWDQQDMWYGVSSHGKVYACGSGFKILYLIDERNLANLSIDREDLVRAAYSIVRLGAKEGLVSIVRVDRSDSWRVVDPRELERLEIEYYFPSELAEVDDTTADRISLPLLNTKLWEFRPREPPALHDHVEYFVPRRLAFIARAGRIRVNKNKVRGVVIDVRFGQRREILIAPNEVLR